LDEKIASCWVVAVKATIKHFGIWRRNFTGPFGSGPPVTQVASRFWTAKDIRRECLVWWGDVAWEAAVIFFLGAGREIT